MQDLWNYDAETKRITDENGLKVANDVVPEDAAVILACREACGLVAAGKVDAAGSTCADALNGGDMLRSIGQPRPPAPRSLWLVLEQMLKWEADQFDGDPSTDLSVSGADLVDAFTEWRTQLRAALKEAPGFKAFDRGYGVGFADGAESDGALVLTKQESNTVLAALRFYQQSGLGDPWKRPADIHEIATDGDEISMDDAGIDALCERLNIGAGQ